MSLAFFHFIIIIILPVLVQYNHIDKFFTNALIHVFTGAPHTTQGGFSQDMPCILRLFHFRIAMEKMNNPTAARLMRAPVARPGVV